MPPTCRNKTARRGPISPPRDWEGLRLRLTVMYLGQGMKLPEIRANLATELGFQARYVVFQRATLSPRFPNATLCSEKQFRDRFRKWGLTKNTKSHLKDYALAGLDGDVVRVSNNVVYLPDGVQIPMHKLRRHQTERLRGARVARKCFWPARR